MAKTISLTYQDKTYVLEFTRASIKTLEQSGFSFIQAAENSQIITMIDNLFYGAFLAHHPYISRDFVEEIQKQIKDMAGLNERLMEMYTDTINSIVEETKEGNIEWGASW